MEGALKNKNGELSAYSFRCGYVQRKSVEDYYVVLYMEHQRYHVRLVPEGSVYIQWETFNSDELVKARKFFRDMVRQAKRLNKWKKNTLK